MAKLRLGRHFGYYKKITEIPYQVHHLGYNFFQFFLGPPDIFSLPSRNISKEDLEEFKRLVQQWDLTCVVHGSYAINLAQPQGSPKRVRSLKMLADQLRMADLIGPRCLGVIIHLGKNVSHLPVKQAVQNFVQGIVQILEDAPGTLILETGASQGNEIGSRLDQLFLIDRGIPAKYRPRMGYCVDTCHIWSSGYPISTSKEVLQYLQEFDHYIGLKRILCIHLNDCAVPLNAHLDRHADLGFGQIGREGIASFLQFSMQNNIPVILETPLSKQNAQEERKFLNDIKKKLSHKLYGKRSMYSVHRQ
jgi:deoxyribonuclease-4